MKKVESGLECGVGADPEWGEWKPGDIIECFDLVDRVQTLESASDELGKKVQELEAAEERKKEAEALAAEQAKQRAEDAPAASEETAFAGKRKQQQRGKQKAGSRR